MRSQKKQKVRIPLAKLMHKQKHHRLLVKKPMVCLYVGRKRDTVIGFSNDDIVIDNRYH